MIKHLNSKLIAALVSALAVACAAIASGVAVAAGSHASENTVLTTPAGDWLTFDYNTQRSGVGPAQTGITAANLHRLKRLTVKIDGIVDSSPVELQDAAIHGHSYDAFFVTTTYGRTLAINVRNGRVLWDYAPASAQKLLGSGQVTTATPVIDPSLKFIYTTSPDGFIHKLSIATGHVIWSTRVTWLPSHEKLASSLNIADGALIVATDGYFGDAPPYEGHVVTIDMASGHIMHVWNSLCSNIKTLINPPNRCSASDSAIWGRPGTVVIPGSGDILVTTGNGPFNGRTDWGDSVLELSPTLKLLHNWTPTNQAQLNAQDWDLGSTEPALLPVSSGPPLAVQGGKEGNLRLLDLDKLDGTAGHAGPRTGGELQSINAPGPTDVYSQPAVWTSHGQIYVFVTDGDGTAAYRLINRRLHRAWEYDKPGTSPLIAGGLLYVYDEQDNLLNVFAPRSGRLLDALPAEGGHWNSPIVINRHIILPEGSYFSHQASGTIDIYHLPGA